MIEFYVRLIIIYTIILVPSYFLSSVISLITQNKNNNLLNNEIISRILKSIYITILLLTIYGILKFFLIIFEIIISLSIFILILYLKINLRCHQDCLKAKLKRELKLISVVLYIILALSLIVSIFSKFLSRWPTFDEVAYYTSAKLSSIKEGLFVYSSYPYPFIQKDFAIFLYRPFWALIVRGLSVIVDNVIDNEISIKYLGLILNSIMILGMILINLITLLRSSELYKHKPLYFLMSIGILFNPMIITLSSTLLPDIIISFLSLSFVSAIINIYINNKIHSLKQLFILTLGSLGYIVSIILIKPQFNLIILLLILLITVYFLDSNAHRMFSKIIINILIIFQLLLMIIPPFVNKISLGPLVYEFKNTTWITYLTAKSIIENYNIIICHLMILIFFYKYKNNLKYLRLVFLVLITMSIIIFTSASAAHWETSRYTLSLYTIIYYLWILIINNNFLILFNTSKLSRYDSTRRILVPSPIFILSIILFILLIVLSYLNFGTLWGDTPRLSRDTIFIYLLIIILFSIISYFMINIILINKKRIINKNYIRFFLEIIIIIILLLINTIILSSYFITHSAFFTNSINHVYNTFTNENVDSKRYDVLMTNTWYYMYPFIRKEKMIALGTYNLFDFYTKINILIKYFNIKILFFKNNILEKIYNTKIEFSDISTIARLVYLKKALTYYGMSSLCTTHVSLNEVSLFKGDKVAIKSPDKISYFLYLKFKPKLINNSTKDAFIFLIAYNEKNYIKKYIASLIIDRARLLEFRIYDGEKIKIYYLTRIHTEHKYEVFIELTSNKYYIVVTDLTQENIVVKRINLDTSKFSDLINKPLIVYLGWPGFGGRIKGYIEVIKVCFYNNNINSFLRKNIFYKQGFSGNTQYIIIQLRHISNITKRNIIYNNYSNILINVQTNISGYFVFISINLRLNSPLESYRTYIIITTPKYNIIKNLTKLEKIPVTFSIPCYIQGVHGLKRYAGWYILMLSDIYIISIINNSIINIQYYINYVNYNIVLAFIISILPLSIIILINIKYFIYLIEK